jgi:hypothetical protein
MKAALFAVRTAWKISGHAGLFDCAGELDF